MRDQVMAELALPWGGDAWAGSWCWNQPGDKGEKKFQKKSHKITQAWMNLMRTKNSNTSLNTKSGCEILSRNSTFLMTFIKLVFKAYSIHNLSWPVEKNVRMFLSLFEYYTSKCASEIQTGIHGRKMAPFKFTFNWKNSINSQCNC